MLVGLWLILFNLAQEPTNIQKSNIPHLYDENPPHGVGQ
jgi:hypothetical protein